MACCGLSADPIVHIGESASLSYLQVVRRGFSDAIGPSSFTIDPFRHQIIEQEIQGEIGSHCEPETQPELATCLHLARQFELAVSGVLDLFDGSWLEDKMTAWVADPNRRNRIESPVIYLALAIGAFASASDAYQDHIAERYFNFGRQLSFVRLLDDPSLATVQAFCLITYYMIASCRRNGAFTNLGIAARSAYALGIHRHETNSAFVYETGIARERAWKSLRVCDLFLSSSMGRPPATSEADCNIPWSRLESFGQNGETSVQFQVASAIFRVCLIFERILVEVYSKKSVSLDLANSISQQHREWTSTLPSMLKVDRLSKLEPGMAEGPQKVGSRIVTMAFYYSIILLSRPFLTFYVCCWAKAAPTVKRDARSLPSEITTFADACVDSAMKGIDLATDIAFDVSMPKRQPLIINSVFISALCLGHAYLGDYDQRGWPIGNSLDTAISVLDHLKSRNPQAARCAEICYLMKEAVALYVQKRAIVLLESSDRHVRSLFGDVGSTIDSCSAIEAPRPSAEGPTQSACFISATSADCHNTILQDSTVTVDGILAANLELGQSLYHSDLQDVESLLDFDDLLSKNDMSLFPLIDEPV